jgi:iron(III) transport system substrate-binding protein
MKEVPMRWLLFAVLLPLLAPLAARAQTPDPALLDAARKEGHVMLYGEVITPTQRAVKAAFEKKYPGIAVDLLYLSGAPMMNRIMSEQGAGRYNADVLMLDVLRMPAVIEKGYVAQYVSTEASHYDAKWQSNPPGYWIQNHLYLYGIMYNKAAVPPDQVPTSYEDLLKPQWAGKLTMVTPVANELTLYFMAGLIRDMGEARAFDFFRALAAQKPLIFGPGGMRVSQGIANGEFPLGLGFIAHVFTVGGGEDGSMSFARINPIYVVSGPGTAVFAHAPHPNAARLFADFMNSREAQELIAGFGYYSTYNGVQQSKPMQGIAISTPPYPTGEAAEALRQKLAAVFGQ